MSKLSKHQIFNYHDYVPNNGEFPKNIRANNITKLVSNDIKMKLVSLNIKNCLRENFSCQKFSQFKRFTEKAWKLQTKFPEFDCLPEYSVSFLCYLELISFLCYLTLILFLLFELSLIGNSPLIIIRVRKKC